MRYTRGGTSTLWRKRVSPWGAMRRAAVPGLMSGEFPARWACGPGELRTAVRAPGVALERVEYTSTAIRTTDPLHAGERREAAGRARDVAAALWQANKSHDLIHRCTPDASRSDPASAATARTPSGSAPRAARVRPAALP